MHITYPGEKGMKHKQPDIVAPSAGRGAEVGLKPLSALQSDSIVHPWLHL